MTTKRGDNTWVAKCGKLGKEIEALRFELKATENLAIKQGEQLQAIANIIKCKPGELARHSTHDLVERVEALQAAIEQLEST